MHAFPLQNSRIIPGGVDGAGVEFRARTWRLGARVWRVGTKPLMGDWPSPVMLRQRRIFSNLGELDVEREGSGGWDRVGWSDNKPFCMTNLRLGAAGPGPGRSRPQRGENTLIPDLPAMRRLQSFIGKMQMAVAASCSDARHTLWIYSTLCHQLVFT